MLSKELKLLMFYNMLRIRRVQERIESLYMQDEMKTPIHLCIGQEAVAVGVCSALKRKDYIMSNHRGHGHYLAKGGSLDSLIAELHCKSTGCSKGFGGSMHLIDKMVGHLGSSSIVAGGIPIGTGLGLSIKMKKDNLVSVVFFGDGAADEGVLYESINFAILKRLPVIFILENNEWAVCSHISNRQKNKNIFHYAPTDMLPSCVTDGNDVIAVYEATAEATNSARNGDGPSFIECKTYRIHGHAGCEKQDIQGYRDQNEVEQWRLKCPIISFSKQLTESGLLSQNEINEMENRISDEIDNAFCFAKESPLPSCECLHDNLFYEG